MHLEQEEDRGVLETAPEEVLKTRRIVRARRGTGAPPSTPTAGAPNATASSNPFAGISILNSFNAQTSEKSGSATAATQVASACGQDSKYLHK